MLLSMNCAHNHYAGKCNSKHCECVCHKVKETKAMAFNYFEKELLGLMTVGEGDAVKVKFQTAMTHTKWLTLRPAEFEAVEALLVDLYSKREQEDDTDSMHRNLERRIEGGNS